MASILLILLGTITITHPRTSLSGTAIEEETVLQMWHVAGAHSQLTPAFRGEQLFRDRTFPFPARWENTFLATCSFQLNGCLSGRTSSFDDCAALVMLKRCRSLFPFHFFW
jgi:hypothetical protein